MDWRIRLPVLSAIKADTMGSEVPQPTANRFILFSSGDGH
jgi:hypothetical protein